MREYVFWFHYNKRLSKIAGKPQITVHYRKTCHYVDNIVLQVPTAGHLRLGEQPNFVIKGKCKEMKIENNIAYIK